MIKLNVDIYVISSTSLFVYNCHSTWHIKSNITQDDRLENVWAFNETECGIK